MADRTKQARERRTEARDRRRAKVEEPFEELDQAARDQAPESTNNDLAGAAAKVVGTAAAAALLGALGGAAKALMERRESEEPQGSEQPEGESDTAPEERASAEPDQNEREEQPEEQPDDDEELEEEPPQAQAATAEQDRETPPAQGVSADQGAEIVAQARQQLGALLGTEAERVSGLERVDGGWTVDLEVVEVSRIPESTDVLATYELRLDDDRNVVSVARKRRYRRSQVDDES
jgi:Gas vesicle synthesis protein GvpO